VYIGVRVHGQMRPATCGYLEDIMIHLLTGSWQTCGDITSAVIHGRG
jgi:hypothetical protein